MGFVSHDIGPPTDVDKPLRSDAERNRDRILAAARSVFAREGLSASMASVARQADVGIATLFRRFPTKDELIEAVFADRMDAYVDAVATALADPDPWRGFTGYIERVCGMQAADRGFAGVLTMTFPMAKTLETRRREAYDGLVALTERAKAAGGLRDDFTPEDMVLLLMANAGVIAATADTAPAAWRRIVALIIQALQAPARGPLPTPPEPSAVYQAMVRQASAAPSRQATN
jgi:AcrR family transcriptional regulator